jgi:hypothetical protein
VIPGAQVLLDQKMLGIVRDDGTFTASGLPLGEHTIEIRKDQFRTRRIARSFAAGETVHLSGGDVALEAALAVVNLNVVPPDSQVTIARFGEAQARPVHGTKLTLPPGTYIVKAEAPNYSPRSITIQVQGGESKIVDLNLALVKSGGVADWDNPERWAQDGNWFVRRGGGFALFRAPSTAGRLVMTLSLRKGRRLQWVLNHVDDRNYFLFQTDKRMFYRIAVHNGTAQELAKVPMGVEYKGYYTIQLRVTTNSVVHEVFDGKTWVTVDSWSDPGLNLTQGRFGLLIPGNEEVGISNFAFYPQ